MATTTTRKETNKRTERKKKADKILPASNPKARWSIKEREDVKYASPGKRERYSLEAHFSRAVAADGHQF